jgi:hypothetical protein
MPSGSSRAWPLPHWHSVRPPGRDSRQSGRHGSAWCVARVLYPGILRYLILSHRSLESPNLHDSLLFTLPQCSIRTLTQLGNDAKKGKPSPDTPRGSALFWMPQTYLAGYGTTTRDVPPFPPRPSIAGRYATSANRQGPGYWAPLQRLPSAFDTRQPVGDL